MALGEVLEGQGTTLFVGESAPPATEVGAVISWSHPQRRNTQQRKYYGNTPTKTITGPSEDTWTFECDLTSADDGQRMIIDAYKNGTEIYVGYTDSEGNGEYQKVRTSATDRGGRNPDDPNSATYEFGGIEDPVDIGSGPA